MVATSPQLLYICSAGHSGSTLLDLLLGGHSDVESLGEIVQLPKNLALNTQCCCGAQVNDCKFWSVVLLRLEKRLNISIENDPYALNLGYIKAVTVVDKNHQTLWQVLRRRIVFALNFLALRYHVPVPQVARDALSTGVRNRWALYEEVSASQNKSVVVDSSKHYLEAVGLYLHRPQNTKIILLTRDGRAVFQSGLKHEMSRQDSLHAWLNTYRRAMPLLQHHVPNENVLRVRYEDLATSPDRVMREICDFSGLDFQEDMLDLGASTNHITNGNNMRFQKGAEIRFDESWKEKITPVDLQYFNDHAQAINQSLGYDGGVSD